MSWQAPSVLWLALAIPLLLGVSAWAVWRRRRRTARYFDLAVAQSLTSGSGSALRTARSLLVLLALSLTILALAGPRYGSRTRILHQRGIDIVVALDFSKSMLARDVRPSRIERAKAELGRLFSELPGDRVGVVAFAGETIEFPMTIDDAALSLFLRDLGPYDMPVGGTAIGKALVASKRLLERSARPASEGAGPGRAQVVLLLTDGEDHEGNPLEAAEALANAGIRVFTVGIGSSTGEPIPTYAPDGTWTGYLRDEEGQPITSSLTPENERALRRIAETTSGQYFRAARGRVGVEQIRDALASLHAEEQEARRITVHEPRYALVLLPGFLLLVLEALLPEAWIGRRRRRRAPGEAEEEVDRQRSAA